MRSLAAVLLFAVAPAVAAQAPLDNADTAAGFYTVGRPTLDFPDPDAAFAALAARGMKGPVTFRIRTGTYTVRESLPHDIRTGAAAADPAAAPLLIRAASPHTRATLVSGADATANWTLRLRGLDYVTLRNLDFDASGTGDFGRILVLKEGADGGGADHVRVEGCTFTGAAAGAAGDERALLWSDQGLHDHLTVTGSTFTDGWAGLWLSDGAGSDRNLDAVVTGNTLAGQAGYGLLADEMDGVTLDGNVVTGNADVAIQLSYTVGFTITTNQIHTTGAAGRGLLLLGTDADAAGTALVANNFIRAARPVLLLDAAGGRFVHNTLSASGTDPPLASEGGGDEIAELANNVLHASAGGPSLALLDLADLVASDGNVFYTPGAAIVDVGGTTYADVEAWQAASGLDAHSRAFVVQLLDPAAGDLHLGPVSDGDPRMAGRPVPDVTTDVDGEPRSADNPTIGADEATPLVPLAGTYTAGEAPPGFPDADYSTLQTALDVAHYLGVSETVTISFYEDSGSLPVTVRPFDGGSEAARLQIAPLTAGTTLTHDPTDEASNGAFRIDGADFVTLSDVSVDVSGGTGEYSQAIQVTGEVEGLRLERLGLTGVPGIGFQGSLATRSAVLAVLGPTTDLLVEDCVATGGAAGFYVTSTGLQPATGTRIVGSRSVDAIFGVWVSAVEAAVVEDVEVESDREGAVGMILYGEGHQATRVHVHVPVSGADVSLGGALFQIPVPAGIERPPGLGPTVVTNSSFNSGGGGLLVQAGVGAEIRHTTIRAEAGTGLHVLDTESLVLENSVVVADAGYAVLLDQTPFFIDEESTMTFGTNDLYTAGPTLALSDDVALDDLEAFQNATGQCAGCVSVPVTFVDTAAGDLHLDGASVGDDALAGFPLGLASPLADVQTDIDGEPRGADAVYLGADEGGVGLAPPPRYVSIHVHGSGEGHHYYGAPAAGLTIDDLADENIVRGVPGYYLHKPVTLWTVFDSATSLWTPSTGTGEVLRLGQAFRWKMFDLEGQGNPDISEGHALPFLLSTGLPANEADVDVTLDTGGDRFNYLANPFGVPLDLTGIDTWPGENHLKGTINVYDPVTGSWELAPDEIAPWQMFKVRTWGPLAGGGDRVLTIPASARILPGARRAAPSRAAVPSLAFRLDGRRADGRGPLSDGMLRVRFAADARVGFDPDEDTEKFQAPSAVYVALGARVGGALVGDDVRPFADAAIPLALDARGAAPTMTLSWDAAALPAGLPVVLVDLATGAEVDVRAASSYAFQAAPRPALAGVPEGEFLDGSEAADRFVLKVGSGLAPAEAVTEVALAPVVPNPSAGGARVSFAVPAAGPVRLSVFDVRGREVAVVASGEVAAGRHEAALPTSLAAGVYVVRLTAAGAVHTRQAVVVR